MRKYASRIDSFGLTWALIGIALTGIAVSIAFTSDPRWMNWHLSRLGEGGHVSSAIFNFTLIAAAMVYVLLANRIAEEVQAHWNQPRAAKILRILFIASAISWIGVACFPFDRFPVIHNIFGYSQFFAVILVMISLGHICPKFSKRSIYAGYLAFGVSVGLMIFFHATHLITLLMVEIIGELLMFAWMISMTHDLRKAAR